MKIIFKYLCYFNVTVTMFKCYKYIIEKNKNNILMHLLLFQMLQIMITTVYQK